MILRTGISLNTRHWEIAVSCMTADLTVATNHTRTDGIHVISLRAKKDKSSQYTYSSMLCEIGDSQLRRRRQTRAMQLGLVALVSGQHQAHDWFFVVSRLRSSRTKQFRASFDHARPSVRSPVSIFFRCLVARPHRCLLLYRSRRNRHQQVFRFFASNSWKQEAILHC